MKMLYACEGSTRLFIFSKQKLYHPLKEYTALAGLEKIRVHDLRHSHVSLLIERGLGPMGIYTKTSSVKRPTFWRGWIL